MNKTFFAASLPLLFAALLFAGCSAPVAFEKVPEGQTVEVRPYVTSTRAYASFSEMALLTLDDTIKTIQEKHFDPSITKVDWQAMRKEFAPRIEKCRSVPAVTAVISEMIGKIGHSHVNIQPPDNKELMAYYEQLAAGKTGTPPKTPELGVRPPRNLPDTPPGTLGMRFSTAEGHLMVMRVLPGTVAEQAGIRPGDELVHIGEYQGRFAITPQLLAIKQPWGLIAQMELSGPSGTKRKFCLLPRDADKVRMYNLTLRPNGLKWTKLGVQDPTTGEFERAWDAENKIGYIFFNPCYPEQIINARRAIKEMTQNGMKGLILDVRGNPGGLGSMTGSLLGHMFKEKTLLFNTVSNIQTSPSYAYPQDVYFGGPLALLIDSGSASSSELLASAVADTGRGRIYGETTAGACLGSNFIELSTGFRLQTVLSNVQRINEKQKDIEAVGVSPDVPVEMSYADVKQGKDSVYEKAKADILEQLAR